MSTLTAAPAQLYGLDLDLANAGRLVTTVLNLLIVPVLILILT
jgi:predicted permease